jgi:DNA-binding SARP family transcriptional activator
VLEISVLGPVEVSRDGRRLPIPGGRTAELLVRLALDAGVRVRAERLVDELWGADAINTRPNTLQSKVARLRRALGDPEAIVSGDGGYALAVAPAAVDALAVLTDAATAAARLGAGEPRAAAELCATALARFQGDLLPGAGDWAQPHRGRLEEARAQLVETRLSARLRLGESDVAGELEAAVAADPYREGLWELLITALYRAGRQADALAAYRRARARLVDDLGLEPGPRLRELEQQVLEHDPALRPPRGNLPSLATELVGRDAEVAALAGLLDAGRLVEVVGPGGIGKTALAIATGRTLPGAVWLIRLESATTPAEVLDTVIAVLDVAGGEGALLERLRSTPRSSSSTIASTSSTRPRRSRSASSTPPPACGSCARARSRSASRARPCSSSRPSPSPTPSSSSPAARPPARARRPRRRASCVGRSTGYHWRSSSRRHGRGRCRSRRSAAASMIASAC